MEENWWSWWDSANQGLKAKAPVYRSDLTSTILTESLHEIASHSTCCTVILKPKKCWLRAGLTASSMTQPYHTLSLLGGAEFVDLNQSSVPFALTTAAWLSKRLMVAIWLLKPAPVFSTGCRIGRNSTFQGHTGFYPSTANTSWRDFGTGKI